MLVLVNSKRKENIEKMISHLKTLSESQFDMSVYRDGSIYSDDKPECESVGCIVGHCTVLDADNVVNNYSLYNQRCNSIRIEFYKWSKDYTGLHGRIWDFCFGENSAIYDNTLSGGIERLELIVKLISIWNNDKDKAERISDMIFDFTKILEKYAPDLEEQSIDDEEKEIVLGNIKSQYKIIKDLINLTQPYEN